MKILTLRFSKKLLSFHHSEYERLCLRCVSSLTTVSDVTRRVQSKQFAGSLLLPSSEPPHSPTRTVKRASMRHLSLLWSANECEPGPISRHPVYLSTLLSHHSAEAAPCRLWSSASHVLVSPRRGWREGIHGGNIGLEGWVSPQQNIPMGAKQTLMVKLRPGGGRSGRPGLPQRWTIHHKSFFPGFFSIQKIWAQMGESFPQTLGCHPLRVREFL